MHLKPYAGVLANPLRGFRNQTMLSRRYPLLMIRFSWRDLEEHDGDPLSRVTDITDAYAGLTPWRNVKMIPYILLDRSALSSIYPNDLPLDEPDSPAFHARIDRLVEKLARAWDEDPRIAYVVAGLERLAPWIPTDKDDGSAVRMTPVASQTLENAVIASFRKWFRHKKLIGAERADAVPFGDIGMEESLDNGALRAARLTGDGWKHGVRGVSRCRSVKANRTMGLPCERAAARDYALYENELTALARESHLTYYYGDVPCDKGSPERAAWERLNGALGWRFTLIEADARADGGWLDVSFTVANTGSAPLYDDWPVQIALLDAETLKPVFRAALDGVSASDWMPGDRFDRGSGRYLDAPMEYRARIRVALPSGAMPAKPCFAALSLLDPAGMTPAAAFANEGYLPGGYTLIGAIGTDVIPEDLMKRTPFDDLALRYAPCVSAHKPCAAPALTDGLMTECVELPAGPVDIDLKGLYRLMSMEIALDAPCAYMVETSPDGVSWRADAHCSARGKGGVVRQYLDGSARFVRVVFDAGERARAYSVRVYGEKEGD